MKLFDPRRKRSFLAGSLVAHLLLAATALSFRSDLDAHAPKVMYAELLSAESPPPAAAGAPKPRTPVRSAEKRGEASLDPAGLRPAFQQTMASAPGPEGKAGEESAEAKIARGNELNLYVNRVVDLLNRARVYPRDALSREEEGVVVLELNVGEDGTPRDEKVQAASPYPSLNRAALETIRRVGHFPPPPRPPLTIHVPIRFQIRH